LQVVLGCPVCVVPAEFVHDVDLSFGGNHGRVLRKGLRGGFVPQIEDRLPVRIVLGSDDVRGPGIKGRAAFVQEEEAAVVLVEVFLVDGLYVVPDSVDPLADARQVRTRPCHHADETTHIAVFPGHDGRVVLERKAGERVLVVQKRGDVFFEHGDDFGVGKEVIHVLAAAPLDVLADTAVVAFGAVANQGENEPETTVVSSLDGVVDMSEGLGIELARSGLEAKLATDAVAHGLRADNAGAHGFGGVKRVIDLKVARIVGARRVEDTITHKAQPLDVGAAETEGLAAQDEAACVALDKFFIVRDLSTPRRCR